MKRVYSFEEIREAEARAIASGVSAEQLMERAGEALARRVQSLMWQYSAADAVVVCGGSGNGGDGFVAARYLKEWGMDVAVVCLAEALSPACRAAREKFGGEVFSVLPRRRYAIGVDCVLGTGISRPLEGGVRALADFLNSCDHVIACDVPTGLGAGGLAFEGAVEAEETLSMGGEKQELYLSDGADLAGQVVSANIGLSPEGGAVVYEDQDVKAFFGKRRSHTNKGSYGTACILAGGAYSGAAFLSAGACLKSGVGLTKLLVTDKVFPSAIGKLPAAVLREFTAIDGDLLGADAIALGMGTGVSERLYVHVAELLTAYTGTLILDADALNTLAEYGVDVLNRKACRVAITPHPKEFSRLMGKSVGEILRDPIKLAKKFAREHGVVVVLKNNRSVITDGERTAINPTGSPVLAKGGSGDVLSGFLAGTAARGVGTFEAAVVASYLLGRAGELAAKEEGEYAPDATDVISRLGAAIKSL